MYESRATYSDDSTSSAGSRGLSIWRGAVGSKYRAPWYHASRTATITTAWRTPRLRSRSQSASKPIATHTAPATPAGMRDDDPVPIDVERIDPGTVVADVIVEPTRFTRLAEERGCRVHVGSGMMNHQLAPMAERLGYGHLDWSAATVTRIATGIAR